MSLDYSTTRNARPQKPSRKRAPKACVSCRSRKVRCDVFFGGAPCTNCSLDGQSCVVVSRGFRAHSQSLDRELVPPKRQQSGQSRNQPSGSRLPTEATPPSTRSQEDSNKQTWVSDEAAGIEETTTEGTETYVNTTERSGASRVGDYEADTSTLVVDAARLLEKDTAYKNFRDDFPPSHDLRRAKAGYLPRLGGRASKADVPYSCFKFLAVNQMHRMSSESVNFLEAQGCFRVPISPILNEFLKEYFLHVHPLLPIINEGDFWEAYSYNLTTEDGGRGLKHGVIPLVLLQAMLLASCSFVPLETIRCLGFPNAREARRTFYERARLLFHLQSELSPLHLSQAALLMSYWSPPFSEAATKQNTTWVRIAVAKAQDAGAHQRISSSYISGVKSPAELREENLLKRLWCCCIVRDRILAFCLRRNVQISRAHFDLDDVPIFTPSDMQDEVNRSRVYNPEVKRNLIEVFVQLAAMCRLMTDAGSLVFPYDKGARWDKLANTEDIARVRTTKVALRQWYRRMSAEFMLPPRLGQPESPNHQKVHDSLTLFTCLTLIYYHSSVIALCHFQMLQSAVASLTTSATFQSESLHNPAEELRDAVFKITECFELLSQHKLHRYLPTTAIACTALPLALHSLGVKMSSTEPNCELNVLNQMMTMYESQYDGVEWVAETVKHILESSDKESMQLQGTGMPAFAPLSRSCMDTLISQPSIYLQVAMTMDLSLCKGRLPGPEDFPGRIQEFFHRSLTSSHGPSGRQSTGICGCNSWRASMINPANSFETLGGEPASKLPSKQASAFGDSSEQPCSKPRVHYPNTDGSTIEPNALLLPESNGLLDVGLPGEFHMDENVRTEKLQNSWTNDAEDFSGGLGSETGLGLLNSREEDRDMQFLLSWLSHDDNNECMSGAVS